METKKLSDVQAIADDGRTFTIERSVTLIPGVSGIGDSDYTTHTEYDYRVKGGEPVAVINAATYRMQDGTIIRLKQ